MKRRDFIALIGGAAAWPLAAQAQQPLPVIGVLAVVPASAFAGRLESLRAGLREHGFLENSNFVFEFGWAASPVEFPQLAAGLAKRRVAVIVASGNAAATAAKGATLSIPIVFTAADDPVRLGLVASFNRPGGNVTGIGLITGALGAKQLELLRGFVPNARLIAVLANPNNPAEEIRVREVQAAAHAIGQRILVAEASGAAEIEPAFAAIARDKADALLVNPDILFTAQRELLVALAARHRVPTMYGWREFAEAGGLMSYGTSLSHSFRQTGAYVGRILKGENPADLPVMQPTNFEFVINVRTAKALRLDVPDRLLALADEVIE